MSEIVNDPIGLIRIAMIDAGCDKGKVDAASTLLSDFFRQPLMPASDQNGLLDLVRDMRTSQMEYDRTSSASAKTQRESHERQVDAALRKIFNREQQSLF